MTDPVQIDLLGIVGTLTQAQRLMLYVYLNSHGVDMNGDPAQDVSGPLFDALRHFGIIEEIPDQDVMKEGAEEYQEIIESQRLLDI